MAVLFVGDAHVEERRVVQTIVEVWALHCVELLFEARPAVHLYGNVGGWQESEAVGNSE